MSVCLSVCAFVSDEEVRLWQATKIYQLYLVFLGHASRGVMSEGGGGKQAGLFRQLSWLIE